MKTEATMLKTFFAITVCVGALIAVLCAMLILTSCSAIEKDKAQIEQVANDVADELIEDAIQKVEKK